MLITGASAGIGLATAKRFAREGARLALAARSIDALEKLAGELRAQGNEAIAIRTDMRVPEQVRQMVEQTVSRFGRLDVLINNAGQGVRGTIAEVNPDYFQQAIDLNVFGPLLAMQAAIPIMRRQGGGLIINISSMTSKLKVQGIGAYAATKATLNKLSETARAELAPDNIRIVLVYPRITQGNFQRNYLGSEGWDPSRIPSDRKLDTPDDVAERILSAAVNEPEDQYME